MRKVILLSALFFITLLFSCKKDGELSPNFDDPTLPILFTDTFNIQSTTVREDSLRTDITLYYLLGLYNDPVFGKKSSSIYSQVSLSGLNVDFGGVAALDSVVLTLKYQGLYGDTITPMNIQVYELTNDLDAATDYFSNSEVAHDVAPLATKSFLPRPTDTVGIAFDTITRDAHLRINLGATFAAKILAGDINGTGDLTDNTLFQQYMKGLYITTTDSVGNTTLLPGAGSISYFDMNSAISTLTAYYSDTLKYEFAINSETVKFSRYAHDYTGTNIEKQLTNNPSKDTTVSYISAMAGVKTKLMIPNIKDILKDGSVIINKAELVVPVEMGTEGVYDDALSSILVVSINENGESILIPDFLEGLSFYGGNLDGSTKTYTFNVSRYIHELIYNTTTDYGMYLLPSSSTISANRSVIGTQQNNLAKIRLNITYSKLK